MCDIYAFIEKDRVNLIDKTNVERRDLFLFLVNMWN